MTEKEARIAFNMIPTVGAVTLDRLLRETHGDVAAAYELYPEKRDWEGKEPDWRRELARAEKMGVTILTAVDAAYPARLRTIASPPLALYVVGAVEALSKPAVALVGTRHCTPYGRDLAERFAYGLAKRGWCVVSGLAHGIDACAHKGALAGEGVTVGVLGCALDMFYPKENRPLARQMVEQGGCVVRAFPFGRSPDPQTFPQRNRVVSGLCRGVVAVECPLHSGTLITCTRAVEQGRAVMAVPGRIDWRTSEGCHHLIREGARMVTSVDGRGRQRGGTLAAGREHRVPQGRTPTPACNAPAAPDGSAGSRPVAGPAKIHARATTSSLCGRGAGVARGYRRRRDARQSHPGFRPFGVPRQHARRLAAPERARPPSARQSRQSHGGTELSAPVPHVRPAWTGPFS